MVKTNITQRNVAAPRRYSRRCFHPNPRKCGKCFTLANSNCQLRCMKCGHELRRSTPTKQGKSTKVCAFCNVPALSNRSHYCLACGHGTFTTRKNTKHKKTAPASIAELPAERPAELAAELPKDELPKDELPAELPIIQGPVSRIKRRKSMRFCAKCETPITGNNAKSCRKCGHRVFKGWLDATPCSKCGKFPKKSDPKQKCKHCGERLRRSKQGKSTKQCSKCGTHAKGNNSKQCYKCGNNVFRKNGVSSSPIGNAMSLDTTLDEFNYDELDIDAFDLDIFEMNSVESWDYFPDISETTLDAAMASAAEPAAEPVGAPVVTRMSVCV